MTTPQLHNIHNLQAPTMSTIIPFGTRVKFSINILLQYPHFPQGEGMILQFEHLPWRPKSAETILKILWDDPSKNDEKFTFFDFTLDDLEIIDQNESNESM